MRHRFPFWIWRDREPSETEVQASIFPQYFVTYRSRYEQSKWLQPKQQQQKHLDLGSAVVAGKDLLLYEISFVRNRWHESARLSPKCRRMIFIVAWLKTLYVVAIKSSPRPLSLARYSEVVNPRYVSKANTESVPYSVTLYVETRKT